MYKLYSVCALLLLCLSCHVDAHSWVACTDYKIDSQADADYWNPSKCRAFPRAWTSVATNTFGEDRGYNYQATETATCRDSIGQQTTYGYPSQYPMAEYTPGQKVCLAWPAKNHVAQTCTNQYIPDTGLKIFASGPNPTSDPTQTQFKNFVIEDAVNGVHQNGVIDFKGFQNCPKFCENMDKALCTGCFDLPNNLQVGAVYTFQWYWIFNQGSAPYTTCWEAKIVGSTGGSGGSTSSSSSGGGSGTSSSSSSSSSSTSTSTSTSSSSSSGGGSGTSSGSGSGTSSSTSSTSTSSSGGDELPQEGDTVIIVKVPDMIPMEGTFTVDIAYSTPMTRQIVVEVVDNNGNGFGKGMATVSGKGTASIKVAMFSSPTKGQMVILRAMIIINGYGNNPVGYELDVQESFVEVGDVQTGNETGSANYNSFSMSMTVGCFITSALFSYWIRN